MSGYYTTYALLKPQSGSVVSGVVFEGPGAYGPYGQASGHGCLVSADGAYHIEVENCEIYNFRGAGIYFYGGTTGIPTWNNDNQRHYIHHSYIHNVQQYGFGYGLGVEGGYQSMLIHACKVEHCRHNIMTAGNSTSAYEVRYSIIGDSDYANNWTGPATIQAHQIDAHGGGYAGFRAGNHLYVHHNTLSANTTFSAKQNVSVRGVVNSEGRFEYNWTKKTTYTGARVDLRTGSNNLMVQLNSEEGGAWDGPGGSTALLTEANCYTNYGGATGNWYGTAAPPETTPTAPVANFSGTPTSGIESLVVQFTDTSTNAPTSWSWNFGDSGTSTLQNPLHTYAAGTFTVTLTATNSSGSDSETKTGYIVVSTTGTVTADFAASPRSGYSPLTVQFDNNSVNSTAWAWDFDNDGDTDSTAENPSYTYTAPGAYTVKLTAYRYLPTGTDTETKASYIQVLAPSGTPKMKIVLTPKSKLANPANQISHMIANS